MFAFDSDAPLDWKMCAGYVYTRPCKGMRRVCLCRSIHIWMEVYRHGIRCMLCCL